MPTTVKKDSTHLGAVPSEGYHLETPEEQTATPVATQSSAQLSAGGATLHTLHSFMAPAGQLGTRDEIQDELDAIAATVRGFHRMQPDLVLRMISAFTARLTELCVLLHRVESHDRQYTRVRTQQVERWLADLDRQFKIASRMVEVNRQDLEMMR